MSAAYLIDKTNKALVFTGKPKTLKKTSVKKIDKEKFTSVVIPNSVKNIGFGAFEDCTFLASARIPNSVFTVGQGSVYGCSDLTSVHIPNSVSSIEDWAFRSCSSLAFVHIPNFVSTICEATFYACTALASVYIPHSVSDIGEYAFMRCSRLHKVCIPNNSKIKEWDISNNSPTCPLETAILRPHLKPIIALQKKSACRVSKASYSMHL